MTLGANIRSIRKERGLTQSEFADKIGLSRSYLSDLENDRKNISTKTLKLLSEKLNVSTNYITTGNKLLRDLTDDEIATEFNDWSQQLNEDKKNKIELIDSKFEYIKNDNLSIIEVQYLTNLMKFFNNATSDEINFIQVLLLQLNKYNDAKYHDYYNEDEIKAVYDDILNGFDNFLKKYLGMNKD